MIQQLQGRGCIARKECPPRYQGDGNLDRLGAEIHDLGLFELVEEAWLRFECSAASQRLRLEPSHLATRFQQLPLPRVR